MSAWIVRFYSEFKTYYYTLDYTHVAVWLSTPSEMIVSSTEFFQAL